MQVSEASTPEYQFNLHRRHISSRNAVKQQTYNQYRHSSFTNQFTTDRTEQLTRFCVRAVKFANIAAPWDTSDPPAIYVEFFNTADSQSVWLAKVPLAFKTTTINEFILALKQASKISGGSIVTLTGSAASAGVANGIFTDGIDGAIKISVSTDPLKKNRIAFEHVNGHFPVGKTCVIHTTFSLGNSPAVGSFNSTYSTIKGNALDVNAASSILGLETPISLSIGQNPASQVANYVYNLAGSSTMYLCSQRLSTASRAYETIRCPVKQCILTIPVAQTTDSYVMYAPIDPTVFVCTGDEQLTSVDFSLRYENGNLVFLGDNALEIELEVETVEINNNIQAQMRESIHLPRVNTYDTQLLLGQSKKRARSSGFVRPSW